MNGRKESLEQAHQSWAQGNFQAAYELYEQLLRSAPNDAEVLREYGQAKYFEYTDLEQATRLFERAVKVDPIRSPPCFGWVSCTLWGMARAIAQR